MRDIFPRIVTQKPDIKLLLVGSINEVISIPLNLAKNIICLGYVDNLAKVYLQTRLVICSLLKGAGTKVKLQEALAYSLPIITTNIGASGLRLTNAVNAWITDDPHVFAAQTLALLENEQLSRQFSEAANLTFQKYYANATVYKQLDSLFGIDDLANKSINLLT